MSAAGDRERYGRHKVLAILVTFVVGWFALELLAPDLKGSLAWIGAWTPKLAFEERASGVPCRARGVLEARLADSTLGSGAAPRWRARGADGHPFTWLDVPGKARPDPVLGDTLDARGEYVWDPGGGTVVTGAARGQAARIRRSGLP